MTVFFVIYYNYVRNLYLISTKLLHFPNISGCIRL